HVHFALGIWVRVEQPRHVPAAIFGEVGHRITALNHHLPQALRRIHPTRIPARHADQRHRLGQLSFQFRETPSGAPPICGEALEVITMLGSARHCYSLRWRCYEPSSSSRMAKSWLSVAVWMSSSSGS